MTRYFYTDPLAAAWMAKHFGMRFSEWNWDNDAFVFVPTTLADDEPDETLYVHPESLRLLDPQIGDIVKHRLDISYEGETPFGYDKMIELRNPKGWLPEKHLWPISGLIRQVVLRNGIPFMWPKVEHEGEFVEQKNAEDTPAEYTELAFRIDHHCDGDFLCKPFTDWHATHTTKRGRK